MPEVYCQYSLINEDFVFVICQHEPAQPPTEEEDNGRDRPSSNAQVLNLYVNVTLNSRCLWQKMWSLKLKGGNRLSLPVVLYNIHTLNCTMHTRVFSLNF